MKCTDKKKTNIRKTTRKIRMTACICAGILFLAGCGTKNYEIQNAYDVYGMKIHYPQEEETAKVHSASERIAFFASALCVSEDVDRGLEQTDSDVAGAVGVFHMDSGEVTCAKNIYEKRYPASTTKVLTAYLALKYGNLSDTVTVSAKAANPSADSSVCNIREGDRLTVEQLLYGLLLNSGNDAAIAIAEHISGSVEQFAELMNKEAALLGATHSHFVNPHGLHDEEHYTCVYDLYLMFRAALEYDTFVEIINTPSYTAKYVDKNGQSVTQDWETTDKFLNGGAQAPEGVTVLGGKTGTTNAAGCCLILYSMNTADEPVVSVVMKADTKDHLYGLMTQLLEK